VAVVDPVLPSSPQSGQLLHSLARIPEFDPLGVQVDLDPFADQPAGHRIDVALDPDGAARFHSHPQLLERLQPTLRQRPKQRHLLGQADLTPTVELTEQLLEEGGVSVSACEVPTAPQHQGLVEGGLEAVVPLFDIAVLVALAGLDGLGSQTVVVEQGLVTPLEGVRTAGRLDSSSQAIGAVQMRNTAEFPEGVLQALAETLEALGEAKGAGLPVGVGQDKVVDQVGERGTLESNAQLVTVGKIGSSQSAGMMPLREEDLPGRSMLGSPLLDPSLQGPQLPVGKASGMSLLQGLEERLGLEGVVERQLLLDPGPDPIEGVLACTPVVLHGNLAGQPVELPVLACGLGIDAGPGSGQSK
jgi:hypothetical protein